MITHRGGWAYGHPPNVPFTMNRQSPQARGLIGWWPTVRCGGNTLFDYSNGANVGQDIPSGVSRVRDSALGMGLNFDGASRFSTDTKFDQLTGATQATFALWIRPGSVTGEQAFFSQWGGTNRFLFEMFTDEIRLAIINGGFLLHQTTTFNLSIGETYHIAVVWHGNGKSVMYRNGGDVVFTTSAVIALPSIVASSIPLWFGDAGQNNKRYTGALWDCRVYNRALSASEVFALYDPATRWELYAPVMPRLVGFAGGVTIPLFMHHYRQMRIGNGF